MNQSIHMISIYMYFVELLRDNLEKPGQLVTLMLLLTECRTFIIVQTYKIHF